MHLQAGVLGKGRQPSSTTKDILAIDKFQKWVYNNHRKRQDLKRLCQVDFLDSPDLTGGGYLTFFVSAIKNTIVKNIILNMYFNIATTSLASQFVLFFRCIINDAPTFKDDCSFFPQNLRFCGSPKAMA